MVWPGAATDLDCVLQRGLDCVLQRGLDCVLQRGLDCVLQRGLDACCDPRLGCVPHRGRRPWTVTPRSVVFAAGCCHRGVGGLS
ncbi:hypothetical protein GCM10027203_56360 [Nonomuraea fastidiosa]